MKMLHTKKKQRRKCRQKKDFVVSLDYDEFTIKFSGVLWKKRSFEMNELCSSIREDNENEGIF